MTNNECPDCGRSFTAPGRHWGQTDCSPPPLTDYQRELTTGVLLGDGWIRKQEHRTHASLIVTMTNEQFLSWLSDQFGIVANDVSMTRSAEQSAGYIDADPADCANQYTLRLRTNPDFDEFFEWYATGEKVFPEIELTSTIAKMWYVCDGGLVWSGDGSNGAAAVITATNETERLDELAGWFEVAGVPRPDVVPGSGWLKWNVSGRRKLLDWMGRPPPGFDYKWCTVSRKQYEQMRDKVEV